MIDRINEAWLHLIEAASGWLPSGTPEHVGRALIVIAIATAFFIVFWRSVRYSFGLFTMKVASLEGTRLKPLRYQNEILLSTQEMIDFAARLLRWLGTAVILIGLYVYVQTVLGQFPATAGLAQQLVGYGVGAIELVFWSIVDYIPSLIVILIILLVARAAVSLSRVFFDGITRRRIRIAGFYPDWGEPTYQLTRGLILVFAAVMIFPYLPGHGSSAFQAIGIFVGVLVSLGSSSAVANIVSGVVLTYMRPFKVGDRVQIADAVGDVIERTTFVTRLRTPKNFDITIANSQVMSNNIINYSARAAREGLILNTSVTIGYDVAWQKVHELLLAAAVATENISEEPAPFVLQTALEDFYVAYELNAYTKSAAEMPNTYSELHRNILDQFNAAEVEIMSPHFRALRDGAAPNIPGRAEPGRSD